MHKSVIAFFILISIYSTAKNSQLYIKNGYLIVDSTFQISKDQFVKFKSIEQDFLKGLNRYLHYPPILRENGFEFEFIISFAIDDQGIFSGTKILKFKSNNNNQPPPSGAHKEWIEKCLKKTGNILDKKFRADIGQKEIYFLPLKFSLGDDEKFEIISGWIHRREKKIPLENHTGGYLKAVEKSEH